MLYIFYLPLMTVILITSPLSLITNLYKPTGRGSITIEWFSTLTLAISSEITGVVDSGVLSNLTKFKLESTLFLRYGNLIASWGVIWTLF